MNTTNNQSPQDFYREQREYVQEQERQAQSEFVASADAAGVGLVDDEMLAQTMRSVRYATEANAISDLVDNSIEAGASQIHIACNFDAKGVVTDVATIDDGAGIVREFLSHALRWGATSRKGRRGLFGRFGHGLSSASVNRGTRYSVFSRVDLDDGFYMATVDLDNLSRDEKTGAVRLPDCVEEGLPEWVVAYCQQHVSGGVGAVKTVVVWSDLDRMTWKKEKALVNGFREHLGICYAGWLNTVKIIVQGEPVEPVDVLFTTPDTRYHEIDGYPNAIPVFTSEVPIADLNGEKHMLKIRISHLPLAAYEAVAKLGLQGRPKKIRMSIRSDYNGIFVCRNGRFIELARPEIRPFASWQPYKRQTAIAIDFPPALDEVFGVTPDKQTIKIPDSVIDTLAAAGVADAVRSVDRVVAKERSVANTKRDVIHIEDGKTRPSEVVMDRVIKLTSSSSGTATGIVQSTETAEKADKELTREVKEHAAATGQDEDSAREVVEHRLAERPFTVVWTSNGADGAFFSWRLVGPQMRLEINTDHVFYSELYSLIPKEAAEVRSALELLLWSLAKTEADSRDDRLVVLRDGRMTTSKWLANALELHPAIFKRAGSKEEARDDDQIGWEEDDSDSVEETADDSQPAS